jgi:hypothetical protein
LARAAARIAALLTALLAFVPGPALADGDPASDFLLSQDFFLPFNAKISAQRQADLESLLREANESGYPIKVAIIAAPFDLGTAGALWGKPQQYARFLGYELAFVYKGRLLIVMPNGYGISWQGHGVARERRVLAALRPPRSTAGEPLVAAASKAVRRLAGSALKRSNEPKASSGGSQTADRIMIAVLALTLSVALVAIVVPRRMRRWLRLERKKKP